MVTEALKSTAVTNLDAAPPIRATAGKGGAARMRTIDAVVTSTDAKTSGSTYRMVRVPTTCIVKHIFASLDAAVTTFTCDIGVYYSSNALDEVGASQGSTGIVNSKQALFGSAVALAAIITPTDYTNESTSYTGALSMKQLWDACGLSSDPGGFFDIVLTNTATNSGAAVVKLEVQFTE